MSKSAELTAEQLATLNDIAEEQRSQFDGKPSRDVSQNFLLFPKLKGSDSYRYKLADAAEALYGMIQKDERVQANFNKPVRLRGRDRGKLGVLPDRPKIEHRFALELLLHSMAHALSRPLTKDQDGRKTRRNFVAVPLDNKAFSKPPFKIPNLNRSVFRTIVYALAIFDPDRQGKPWLEYAPAINFPGNAKRTCVMADTPFREWMFRQGLIFPYHPDGPSPEKSDSAKKAKESPLWVSYKPRKKGEEKKYVSLDRPLHGEEEVLPAINAALSNQKLACHFSSYAEYDKKYYDYREGRPKTALGGNQRLYRQFAEEDGRGGRLYGHWVQTLPSELRRRLTIEGKPVDELDFGSMQLALLYAMAGVPVPKVDDLYEMPGMNYPREDMKMVLTLSVGNATGQKTVRAIGGRLRDEQRSEPGLAKKLYNEFWSHHEAANPHRISGGVDPWIALQNLDSRIACAIMSKLLDKGIVAIPVHDSFIVDRDHTAVTKEVMLEVFAEYCPGTTVQVKITPEGA